MKTIKRNNGNDIKIYATTLEDAATEPEVPKMTSEDFISKTKKLLSEIETAYGHSWQNRTITDKELDVAPCEECKGSSCFKWHDKEVNCFQDPEQGQCYERFFDADGFAEFMEEEIIFGNKPFYELLSCDIVPSASEGNGA